MSEIGHNRPPSDEKILLEQLRGDHKDVIENYHATVKQAADMPAIVEDDAMSGQVTDYIAELKKLAKELESLRVDDVAPYVMGQRVVNNFFKSMGENLDKIRKKVDGANQKYLIAKADKERREREAVAEAERLETERKLQEALDAQKKLDDENKRLQEEDEKKQQELDKKQAEIDELKKKNDASTEIIAQKEEEAAQLQENLERPVVHRHWSSSSVRRARLAASAAIDAAVRQDQVASKAQREASVKLSTLSKTRGDIGTAAVAEKWVVQVTDAMLIDLEMIREYLPFDAIQQAAEGWLRVQEKPIIGQPLKGAKIYEELQTQYR